jgi:hypothetical protein
VIVANEDISPPENRRLAKMAGAEGRIANPDRWPFLPLDPRPIGLRPLLGWWVWLIPEKVRHSSFHEVAAVEQLRIEEDPPVDVVEATCGLAWPLDHFAAAVPAHHPALALVVDSHHAACQNCSSGTRRGRRSSFWSKRLAEQRDG